MNRSLAGGLTAGFLVLIGVLGISRIASRDASSGATFRGVDPSGHEVRVHLFNLVGYEDAPSWQGWLFQDGTGVFREEYTTNQDAWPLRWTDPRSTNSAAIEAKSTGSGGPTPGLAIQWNSGETVHAFREYSHRVLYRRRGLQGSGWGCIKEYRAEFPDLPATDGLSRVILREIQSRCRSEARDFTEGILSHTWEAWRDGWPASMTRWTLEEHWQIRLLSGDVASVVVWSYPSTGGVGNHTRFAGLNWILDGDHLRDLDLSDLFRSELNWETSLRQRCVPKLARASAFDPEAVLDPQVDLSVFTMSPEGLQLYFNPYTIGSGAEGFYMIHFDTRELSDLVRPDGPLARRR